MVTNCPVLWERASEEQRKEVKVRFPEVDIKFAMNCILEREQLQCATRLWYLGFLLVEGPFFQASPLSFDFVL